MPATVAEAARRPSRNTRRNTLDLRTSESVTEGHPDKVADFIADSILDAHLEQDSAARVAAEVLVKGGAVVVAGEITSTSAVDLAAVVRSAINDVGYSDPSESFHAKGVAISTFVSQQAREISRGVASGAEQGAGDQGLMVGYATDETPSLMPLPIVLAHAITRQLADERKRGTAPWLRPDGKAQVTVRYRDGRPEEVVRVVVSTQHVSGALPTVREYIQEGILPSALGPWLSAGARIDVNPAGTFETGGPSADCGVTGRKIIVDSYGGAARHGGGAFSGKDPSKVDRSGAYFCRWAARQVVLKGLATRAEVEVAYAIGLPDPVSLRVHTFGTGDEAEADELLRSFTFRPYSIIRQLDLLRPIYRRTTNYGHFGKPDLPWEA